nr:MAG TPA: hypothetical protein [Caudoviricetes sp.]
MCVLEVIKYIYNLIYNRYKLFYSSLQQDKNKL